MTPLIVEAHLDRARVTGITQLAENRRLVDILANQDASFELQAAEARLDGSDEGNRFKSVTIKKSDVLYAIPRETTEQIRSRALFRAGMTTQATSPMLLAILLPGCHISGTALVPPSIGSGKLEVGKFPSFFAVTGAVITQPDGTRREEQVVIVARDAILAIGRPDDV